MKKALRLEMKSVMAKSTLDRWIGAMRTGPVDGMFAAPLTVGRKRMRARSATSPATTR
ncbi:MAG: hypothetical protein ACHQFZ_10195 [Acidimicrobiales bacterium]